MTPSDTNVSLVDLYPPADCERLSASPSVIFHGDAPTFRQAEKRYQAPFVDAWIATMLSHMFALSSASVASINIQSLCMTIRSYYWWMKLTEFMHFVYLYRAGEFGKTYGKADGQTVTTALMEYKAKLKALRDDCPPTLEADNPQEWNYSNDTTNAIAQALVSPDFQRYGLWRSEPWAPQMARAFFADHSLVTFPGDMSFDDRQAWAIAHNIPVN